MTSTSLAMAWLQLLALLAGEVTLIVVAVALLRRWSPSAAWSRTFCQAGIVTVLVITACELSGSARVLGGWAAGALAWRQGEPLPGRRETPGTPSPAPASLPVIASSSDFAGWGAGVPGAQPSSDAMRPSRPDETRPEPTMAREAFSTTPEPVAPRSLDAVADSMRVLWLCVLWATGAVLAGARACLAQCLFVIFPLRRRPVMAPALVDRVQALARALGMRRPVRVIEAKWLTSPIAFGLIQPTVGLPPDFAGQFDAAKQDAILAHELAHLAAHDPFWCLLADLGTTVLWWHPGVWWLRRQLHLASEMVADEASLLVADGPRVLAECLVELAARLTRPLLFSHLRVSGFRSHLGRRVHRLVHLESREWSPPSRWGATVTRIFGPVAMTAAVVLCTAWASPQALTKGDSMKSMQLNWKRSLAAFALLAAFNGPETPVAVGQTNEPKPVPELAPVAPAAPAVPDTRPEASEAPAPPELPAPLAAAADPFAPPSNIPARAVGEGTDTKQAQAMEVFRRRYGMFGPQTPVRTPRTAERPSRGAKLEAKLKQIVLSEIAFDGLPLGEVLRFLSTESLKGDPDETGINFLINPNIRLAAHPAVVDPATGLPVAGSREQFDLASVMVTFSLPLRKVTMKDVLDAIVIVADHPIEYTVEDFAVVFSAKPQAVAALPALAPRPMRTPVPPQAPRSRNEYVPLLAPPGGSSGIKRQHSDEGRKLDAELADVKPQPFNIDFGPSEPSPQVGPAAAGCAGDFWNSVSDPFNDHHTRSDLKFAGGDPSPIEVEMINLGGAWGSDGRMGMKSDMLNNFNYPTSNKGGNAQVILHHVPAGKYNVFIYGHGTMPGYYGDYKLTVGRHEYGRKQTSHDMDAVRNTKWVEGSQYVQFSGVQVDIGDEVEVLIRPGAQVTLPDGRTFADAIICGLQLIPVK